MVADKNVLKREKKDLFDIIERSANLYGDYTAEEIAQAIKKLTEAQCFAERCEAKAQQQREQKEAERKALEERAAKEAHIKQVTCMDLPLDWNNIFANDLRVEDVHAESTGDGLVLSLTTLGKVDIEYIAAVTGEDYKTVISTLRGAIYQNPQTWGECFYHGWETAEEYLSGNIMEKWQSAKEANEKYDGYFSTNLTALEQIMPQVMNVEDIYVTLGSPWVPGDIIDEFIWHLGGDPLKYERYNEFEKKIIMEKWKTAHDEVTGTWEIKHKSRYGHSVAAEQIYGTKKMNALSILEKTLNLRAIEVMETRENKKVINQAETLAAKEKQQKMICEFKSWVWADEARKKRLLKIYNEKFGFRMRRIFDGSFLTFPTMSSAVELYSYQKDAVARIIFTPNTLLAHEVGSGKTYTMIAAGQKLRQMGLSSKNMYVVPNNIVNQWRSIFLKMYPQAKLLVITPQNFTPNKREQLLCRIRDEDFDGIIIAYSSFERIALSKEYYLANLNEKKAAVNKLLKEQNKATLSLKRKQKNLEKALSELANAADEMYEGIYFDELGITRLFVDEAHNFKNMPLETKSKYILGINIKGSQKCRDMLDKIRVIQKQNNGGGVVLATGTPITNSISEVYVMQQYLQSGELALLGLQNFDSWLGMFAEQNVELEVDVDPSKYRWIDRIAKFHNLPELTTLLAMIADFHQLDKDEKLPLKNGYIDITVPKTPALAVYLNNISQRADDIRQRSVSHKADNMLKITTDGRKAALDMRLVNPVEAFSYDSKIAACVKNVAEIYFKTQDDCAVQLIFCDISTPKNGFNVYDELRKRLIILGITSKEIAFIHEAVTEKERADLFAAVRSGRVRILIGSTFKVGMGVNIQDNLFALHHLDVPWRPSDMTQREGRILRRGNQNSEIYIYRYITEGSFDAYSWQLLESKQRFIGELLSGYFTGRAMDDINDTLLDYAEVKALAVGDPLLKQRIEKVNELRRLQLLQQKAIETHLKNICEIEEISGKINKLHEDIHNCANDREYYEQRQSSESENRQELQMKLHIALKEHILEPKEKLLQNYRGFELIIPAGLTKDKPYIWLKRQGKYYVELGLTEKGNLRRIDNFLSSLGERQVRLENSLSKLTETKAALKAETECEANYSTKNAELKQAISLLNKVLGVANDE